MIKLSEEGSHTAGKMESPEKVQGAREKHLG